MDLQDPVSLLPAGQMPCAKNRMAQARALVFQTISATRTKVVDRSVLSIPTAHRIWHVLIQNARILAQEHVDRMQNVKSLITCQCAFVTRDTPVILSATALRLSKVWNDGDQRLILKSIHCIHNSDLLLVFYAILWIIFLLLDKPLPPRDPCNPSQCGPNSQCRVINEQAVCSCSPEYIGSPPACRPECVVSSECTSNRACIRRKCVDPCIGRCGSNSRCETINHSPICSCQQGYTGDPFVTCFEIPSK